MVEGYRGRFGGRLLKVAARIVTDDAESLVALVEERALEVHGAAGPLEKHECHLERLVVRLVDLALSEGGREGVSEGERERGREGESE